MTDREGWLLQVVIEADEAGAEQATHAIEQALCPDPNHEGQCATPWTLVKTKLADLDDAERKAWTELLES